VRADEDLFPIEGAEPFKIERIDVIESGDKYTGGVRR